MCPEPGLISAWVDGEVGSPWKERLAAHIEACPACAARAGRYSRLSADLAEPAALDEAAVVARIEARLGGRLGGRLGSSPAGHSAAGQPAAALDARGTASADAARAGLGLVQPEAPVPASARPLLWRRRVIVPMPVAAAAAALFVFLAGVAASSFIRPAKPSVQAIAAAEMAPSGPQASSMEALVHYLESQNAQVNLTIQLPSGATFDSGGKPVVIKATDANYAPFSATVPSTEGSKP